MTKRQLARQLRADIIERFGNDDINPAAVRRTPDAEVISTVARAWSAVRVGGREPTAAEINAAAKRAADAEEFLEQIAEVVGGVEPPDPPADGHEAGVLTLLEDARELGAGHPDQEVPGIGAWKILVDALVEQTQQLGMPREVLEETISERWGAQ